MHPALHHVGAVAHGVFGLGAILFTVLFHYVLPLGIINGAGAHLQEGSHGISQRDLQGLVVQSLYAQFFNGGAVLDLLIALDGGEEEFVGAAGGGIGGTPQGVYIILCGDFLTVGPLVVPQVEGPHGAVSAEFPGLGIAGSHVVFSVLLFQTNQTLHHIVDDGAGISIGIQGDVHGSGVSHHVSVVILGNRLSGGILCLVAGGFLLVLGGPGGLLLVVFGELALLIVAAGGHGKKHGQGQENTQCLLHQCVSSLFIHRIFPAVYRQSIAYTLVFSQ